MIGRAMIVAMALSLPLVAQETIPDRPHEQKVAQYEADVKTAAKMAQKRTIAIQKHNVKNAADQLNRIRKDKSLTVKERREEMKLPSNNLRKYRKLLKDAQKNMPRALVRIPITGAKVGQIGELTHTMEVDQIVSGTEVLVSVGKPDSYDRLVFWVRNVTTAGHTDYSSVRMPGLWEIIGTKKYRTTNGGARTVFLLQQFHIGGPLEDDDGKPRDPPPRKLFKAA